MSVFVSCDHCTSMLRAGPIPGPYVELADLLPEGWTLYDGATLTCPACWAKGKRGKK